MYTISTAVIGGGPSHGHTYHVLKISEIWTQRNAFGMNESRESAVDN